jgi:hypothetical protein
MISASESAYFMAVFHRVPIGEFIDGLDTTGAHLHASVTDSYARELGDGLDQEWP